ncbi:MAG: hypothetical protein Greene071421_85 [Parcubacteria group bacterium Greene0714_21]|nr:MAG: hypothetical protein Greene041639_536 [Parcubacteria group bacterium Greene0416_39]TSC97775.1 MAG: hypothetical protein Greene101447_311 [Parcubacteria group bacterium Greene1014_47]TSD04249.1 MAG: hypothetical protein Greene071421_85 [Parcubacteria group bacterium Greene0714_21]
MTPKVGLVSFHSFKNPGGVKAHILGLYKEYKKRGFDVKVIVPRREKQESYGADFILLGTSFPFFFNKSQADLVVNFNPLAIKKVLDKEKFDILHLHNVSFPSAFEILWFSKATNILTFHANLDAAGSILKRFPILLNTLRRFANWKIHGIIGVAPLNLEVFPSYKGLKRVIPNGIDVNVFRPNNPPLEEFEDGKVNILFVGRIEERKGLLHLLKAYEILQKTHENLRLLVVGEGPLENQARAYVKEKNLKEVHFFGRKTEEELKRYYVTADLYCSPALYGESFGIVLLEAMASGTPVTGFANKGYFQLLQGKKGERFLAPPGNVEELAKRIDELVRNESLRKEMGQWGVQEAQNYSWDKVAQRVLDFYSEVLDKTIYRHHTEK